MHIFFLCFEFCYFFFCLGAVAGAIIAAVASISFFFFDEIGT